VAKTCTFTSRPRTLGVRAVFVLVLLSLDATHRHCHGEEGPRERLASAQQQLASAEKAYLEVTLSYYMSGQGVTVKQPPASAVIAWEKPSFYYVYEPQLDKSANPACWYWLVESKLQAFQLWEKGRPYDHAQARGVRVTNFAQLSGDGADAAFRLAKDKTIDFAVVGGHAANYLELLNEAHSKAMEIEKRDGGWRLKQKATDFKNLIVQESLPDDKSGAFVVFDVAEAEQPLKAISIYYDLNKWPEYGESMAIDKLQFALDRKSLTFPKQPELIKPVELKEKGKLRSEVLDSIPPVPTDSGQ
jgi:hypothetical protein